MAKKIVGLFGVSVTWYKNPKIQLTNRPFVSKKLLGSGIL